MKQLVPIVTLAMFCLFASQALAQNKQEVRLFYSFSYTDFTEGDERDGASSYSLNNNSEFGILYLRKFSKRFALRTGIGYSFQKLKTDHKLPDFCGTPPVHESPSFSRTRPFESLHIPVGLEVTLFEFLYAHGGIIYSDQLAGGSDYRNAGLGYDIGVGFKYDIGRFSLHVNPNFKLRNAHYFTKGDKIEANTWGSSGLDFMIGYSF
ncbi:hypothetical protein FUAX_13120 [Fulvitalea axinellae]|uniref:Outer membrane protein beta-barrel domain-containing protein n=1 Tax=Fulvitalea axinellae TaxID=1182444 RepID=A0AAU9D9C2_9BACT|nr:hypothetical protein FUAX_13120 [Fulvitalea axinellae]